MRTMNRPETTGMSSARQTQLSHEIRTRQFSWPGPANLSYLATHGCGIAVISELGRRL